MNDCGSDQNAVWMKGDYNGWSYGAIRRTTIGVQLRRQQIELIHPVIKGWWIV